MILIEIVLILIWILLLTYLLIKHKSNKHALLLVAGFIVGSLFIWLDNYYGQITYTTNINIPYIKYPIAIIALASLYFFFIVFLKDYILKKLFSKRENRYVTILIGFILTVVLNFLYPIVDFVIVNMKGGFFTNDYINQFYKTFSYNADIKQYQFYAYISFLLAINLSMITRWGLQKLFKLYCNFKNKSVF
jgi:hypothetical protein